jgi:hypothetical protein
MKSKKHNPAISVWLFWTARIRSPLTWLIVRVTGRRLPDKSDAWAHMGVGFTMADGREIYFECLYHDGFAGPKPREKLQAFWVAGGRLKIHRIPGLTGYAAHRIYLTCSEWVGKKGYFAWQLAMMWAFERLGIRVPPSPDRLVCSEAAARLLWPHLDLRDEHRDFDEVNPNSAYRRFLEISSQRASGHVARQV